MSKIILPAGYKPALSLYDTQRAIGTVKRLFADTLCATLNLRRVSAPLFVEASSGLNDDLNGVERKVSFDIKDTGVTAEVVQSLAKWKRKALKDYDFHVGKGLYCDMNAIRRDEELDNLHSVYVDQWDWEKVIREEDRNLDYLKGVVRGIVSAVCATEMNLHAMFPQLEKLPLHSPSVTFITSQELEDLYPALTPKEREDAFVREHGTTFLMQIGRALRSGKPHDGRAPDYDDWDLNGDLLFWNDPEPGPPADRSRLRRPPRPALPQGAAGRRAALHHRRRHRPEPAVYAASGQRPHRRGAGHRLGRRHPRSLREGRHPPAVNNARARPHTTGTGPFCTLILRPGRPGRRQRGRGCRRGRPRPPPCRRCGPTENWRRPEARPQSQTGTGPPAPS